MATANVHAAAKMVDRSQSSDTETRRFRGRLKIDAQFCPTDVADPFDTVEWQVRTSQIKGENGELVFEQDNCEVPSFWSQLATNVICSKYFYGEVGTDEREYSVRHLVHRVARTIADWGLEDGYFASPQDGERFYRDLAWLCLHQHGAFNSPVWFNVGLYHQYGVEGAKCNWRWDPQTQSVQQPENPYEFPQGSACFIQHVEDNMEDIMELARSEAMLFKFGSGTGTDLSTLRSHREKLSGGGRPSGPLSFMRVYDQIAAVVKSGGKTRRAAKMQSLKVWHPDIMEFIECKWKEEQKAHILIEKGGYDANFNGEAYSSIMFQNANLSVRVTDDFMQAVERNEPWTTHWVTDAKFPGPEYQAREVMDRMAECAWHCGDPGVQYDTTINRWHTCPNSGRINASNPCVTGDTLVATTDGYRRMEDLVGETVEIINGHGQRVWVDRVFPTGHKPVYELKTRAGYRLRLTADHRVWTSNRGDVPADELTIDDVVQLRGPGFGMEFLPEVFAELLGATVGGSSFAVDEAGRRHLTIDLGLHEQLVAERIRDGVDQCQRWLHAGSAEQISSATCVAVQGDAMRPVLDKIGEFIDIEIRSQAERLSDRVYALDKPSQAAILRGLFTAHGMVVSDPRLPRSVALVSGNVHLLEQVQLLLLGFGIRSRIRSNRRALGQVVTAAASGIETDQPCADDQLHALNITEGSCVRFENEIGFFEGSKKASQLAENNENEGRDADPLYDRIASLTPSGEENVFDLTEPVSQHFVANGIVVHNCSEYMFLDDTACNLASINLMKFRRPDGTFDSERFVAAARVFFIAQEILVDHASYPTRDIARNSHLFRPLGLGYSNLGSLLMTSGLAYDSDAGRGVCGALTALLHGAANLTSSELAEAVGPFDEYEKNREPFLRVMQMHREAVEEIDDECPQYLRDSARQLWDEVLAAGSVHGFRNAQATVLAPTGTISFMMDCDTTGIEPDIALVKYKQLAGGGMLKMVNRTVPLALEKLAYDQSQIDSIVAYVDEHDTIEGSPALKDGHLSIFDCAFTPRSGTRSIAWRAHVKMMAAAQPFLSGAISKTVNMPRQTTPAEIAEAYLDGWRMGLKALAIYRDGSKESQPLSTGTEADKAADKLKLQVVSKPYRQRLPDTRQSITHKFSVSGHEGYITVGLYPDGRPGELFITMAKEGSTIGGLMDAFGTAVSMSLQYGVPLEDYVRKFSHMRFEPQGYTKNPDIRIAKSLIDYIFRWLGITFLPGYREASLGQGDDKPEGGNQGSASDDTSQTAPAATKAGGREEESGGRSQESGEKGAQSSAVSPPVQADSETANGANGYQNGHTHALDTKLLERAGVLPKASVRSSSTSGDDDLSARSEMYADFQADAPACDNCGAITVRSGNCYLCHNCGSSMGCS